MNSRKTCLLVVLLSAQACTNQSNPEPPSLPLFFQSGFEDGVEARDNGAGPCSGDITGSDDSTLSDWVIDLESSPIEKASFCYGGDDDYAATGTLQQRSIELTADPMHPSNTVLRTWVAEPAENYDSQDLDDEACSCVEGQDSDGLSCEDLPTDEDGRFLDNYDSPGTRKGRVQIAILSEEDNPIAHFTYSTRLLLGEGYQAINTGLEQKLNWMTIGEFWNQGPASIDKGDRSRVTLNLVKETANSPLHFGLKMDIQADGEKEWECIWPDCTANQDHHLLSDIPVPLGEWFTLKVSLIAGDDTNGRTLVDFVDSQGEERRLFDVSGATIYPGSPTKGFTNISPIKLYTGGNLVCWLKNLGLPMDAYWDDFSLSLSTQPQNPSEL